MLNSNFVFVVSQYFPSAIFEFIFLHSISSPHIVDCKLLDFLCRLNWPCSFYAFLKQLLKLFFKIIFAFWLWLLVAFVLHFWNVWLWQTDYDCLVLFLFLRWRTIFPFYFISQFLRLDLSQLQYHSLSNSFCNPVLCYTNFFNRLRFVEVNFIGTNLQF